MNPNQELRAIHIELRKSMIETNKKFVFDMDELKSAEFPLDELFFLQVNYHNVKYESLIKLSSYNKNLICFGSGAYDHEKFLPPVFYRHSWYDKFDESVIYYNDPTLYLDPNLKLGWGVGKDDDWYLLIIAKIIRILAFKHDVKNENMLFFGSSGGGFTAIILSTLIKKSKAIVNNPQIFLKNYWKRLFENMIDVCFGDLDLETILTRYGYRLDAVEMFKHENYMPPITYMVNSNSKADVSNQLIPFINSLDSFEYFKDRIDIKLYQHEDGHKGFVGGEETIELLKNHFNSSKEENITSLRKDYEKLNDQLKTLKEDSINTRKQLKLIANARPYRFAYLLRRFFHEFLKGSTKNKRDFLKWITHKMTKKESNLEAKYNPLTKLIKN